MPVQYQLRYAAPYWGTPHPNRVTHNPVWATLHPAELRCSLLRHWTLHLTKLSLSLSGLRCTLLSYATSYRATLHSWSIQLSLGRMTNFILFLCNKNIFKNAPPPALPIGLCIHLVRCSEKPLPGQRSLCQILVKSYDWLIHSNKILGQTFPGLSWWLAVETILTATPKK